MWCGGKGSCVCVFLLCWCNRQSCHLSCMRPVRLRVPGVCAYVGLHLRPHDHAAPECSVCGCGCGVGSFLLRLELQLLCSCSRRAVSVTTCTECKTQNTITARYVLNPGHGSPPYGPSVARSLGHAKHPQRSPGVGPNYRLAVHPSCGPLWPSSASEVD